MNTLSDNFYDELATFLNIPPWYLRSNTENVQGLYGGRYFEILREMQKSLRDEIKIFFNYFIKKYGGWDKYPRKTKKRLKKAKIWYWKDINIDDLKIKVK